MVGEEEDLVAAWGKGYLKSLPGGTGWGQKETIVSWPVSE